MAGYHIDDGAAVGAKRGVQYAGRERGAANEPAEFVRSTHAEDAGRIRRLAADGRTAGAAAAVRTAGGAAVRRACCAAAARTSLHHGIC